MKIKLTENFWDDDFDFEEIASKSVRDTDGFYTDYTWYHNLETDEHVFVFGDKEIYRPEDGDFDYECDSEEEASEWFDNYNGLDESLEDTDNITVVGCISKGGNTNYYGVMESEEVSTVDEAMEIVWSYLMEGYYVKMITSEGTRYFDADKVEIEYAESPEDFEVVRE